MGTVLKPLVLDANALLILMYDAPGALDVREALRATENGEARPAISTVQLSEIAHALRSRPDYPDLISAVLRLEATVDFVPLDAARALQAAGVRRETGLSFADAVAVTLAMERNAVLMTADRDFKRAEKKVKIRWIGSDEA